MSQFQKLNDYLRHMAEAASKIASYIEGMEEADFRKDERTQEAVIFNLMIVGEATSKFLKGHGDFLQRYPDVSWASMKGMRNRIAHGYFEINLGIVWETARTAMPDLLTRLPALIAVAEAES